MERHKLNWLNRFDAQLQGVRQFDDYWYDVGMSDAIAFLAHFSDEDWAGLQIMVSERPSLWRAACAETLSETTDKERSFDLLMALLRVGSDEVLVAALDSINALASYGLDIKSKAAQLHCAIRKAKNNAGAAVSLMLTALEGKLPPA